jgi:hypothetical protein
MNHVLIVRNRCGVLTLRHKDYHPWGSGRVGRLLDGSGNNFGSTCEEVVRKIVPFLEEEIDALETALHHRKEQLRVLRDVLEQ